MTRHKGSGVFRDQTPRALEKDGRNAPRAFLVISAPTVVSSGA